MTFAPQRELTIRPITGPEELGLFTRLSYMLDDELADDLASGRRHPGWMWVALRGDRLVARLAWWSRPGDAAPFLLDVFDLAEATGGSDAVEDGVRLLRTAMAQVLRDGARPPEYLRYLPPRWRQDPAARSVVETRVTALERTGARLFVERLRLEWRPGTDIPAPTGRLVFRPVAGRDELVDLMTEVLRGTLDAHGREELTRMSAREAAVRQYEEELAGYQSPRDWWRVATLPGGDPVGFVIPAHNSYNPIIAYIGVVPGRRGNGHVDEILAEGTRILAAEGVPRVRASTDVGNVPMARAFQRAGYAEIGREIDYTWT
ncbi:N-acetyltransferase [Sphaerisporangium melleum]|uniref:N-acetyltransferase n=1 Tax=Sphaerisporangium melleum TaxID=321316 RepID=A0A917VRT1_9ACTN|nr:GNAT family N-acetyltransferase [Sphaerisporangium melleum]GGL07997.1 N-acetyltransferase [Sphaerisporangium melleum]GII74292.1 N-acetyltransferase [Sphaerisporangium melleum]